MTGTSDSQLKLQLQWLSVPQSGHGLGVYYTHMAPARERQYVLRCAGTGKIAVRGHAKGNSSVMTPARTTRHACKCGLVSASVRRSRHVSCQLKHPVPKTMLTQVAGPQHRLRLQLEASAA